MSRENQSNNVIFPFDDINLSLSHIFFDNSDLRSACYKSPCMNEGKCVAVDDTFKCICKNGFSGSTCEGLLKPILF